MVAVIANCNIKALDRISSIAQYSTWIRIIVKNVIWTSVKYISLNGYLCLLKCLYASSMIPSIHLFLFWTDWKSEAVVEIIHTFCVTLSD